jgi:hypothetical protein
MASVRAAPDRPEINFRAKKRRRINPALAHLSPIHGALFCSSATSHLHRTQVQVSPSGSPKLAAL